MSFGLTLIGQAVDYLPYVVFALSEMARHGLGARRGVFELKDVWLKGAAGERELIYSNGGFLVLRRPASPSFIRLAR